jgi:hypothetical protein
MVVLLLLLVVILLLVLVLLVFVLVFVGEILVMVGLGWGVPEVGVGVIVLNGCYTGYFAMSRLSIEVNLYSLKVIDCRIGLIDFVAVILVFTDGIGAICFSFMVLGSN